MQRHSDEVADKIMASGFSPDVLIGIATGGLIPLSLLARRFPEAEVLTISAKSYEKETQGQIQIGGLPDTNLAGKNVLVVDEIVDRGTTLKRVKELLADKGIMSIQTAVLFVHKEHCEFPPDFYAKETAEWIVFPWEKE